MKKIIVTGFPSFGNYQENSSSLLKDVFSKFYAFDVEFIMAPIRLFSVEARNFGDQVVNRALNLKADAIISLGMSSSVKGIRIESVAKNWVENDKYCLKFENRAVLDDNFSSNYSLTANLKQWDLPSIFNNLQDWGIPYEELVSTNAGNFCCNATMFRILQAMKVRNCFLPYIFVRISCTAKAIMTTPDFHKEKTLMTQTQINNAFFIFASFFTS